MSTATIAAASKRFDLSEAIAEALPTILQAYPDWDIEDQSGLEAAIRSDAITFVETNVSTDCLSTEEATAFVESRMFEDFLSGLPISEPPSDLREADVPVPISGKTIDLLGEISKIVPFLDHDQCYVLAGEVYPHLEKLVGEALTDGMSDSLLDEFGCFADKDAEGIDAWFASNLPGYEADEDFQKLLAANPEADRIDVLAEFGASQWLAKNRPDYPQITAQQAARLEAALTDLVTQTGKDVIQVWARVQAMWVEMLKRASCGRAVFTGAAFLISHEGADAVEQWASVETQLYNLDERAAAMDDVR